MNLKVGRSKKIAVWCWGWRSRGCWVSGDTSPSGVASNVQKELEAVLQKWDAAWQDVEVAGGDLGWRLRTAE